MTIDVADIKAHLNITANTDDTLLGGKIAAAEQWIEKFLGVALADFEDDVPAPILEAVRQLVGHLYENREASLVGVSVNELPFGLVDLLAPYRDWQF